MSSVCFYFQVHQPHRLKTYDCFKIGYDHAYHDEEGDKTIINRVADKCYIPANKIMLALIKKHRGDFKIAYSISGTALEQLEQHRPDVIASFRELAATGCVEFLAETYYHSLSFLYSREEFVRQVGKHRQKIETLFKQAPRVFRNTELIYNNELASYIDGMGFKGILCEGLDRILGHRSPNFLYHPPHNHKFKCLLKNYKLSDDVAFRFSDSRWVEYPLTASKFAHWIHNAAGNSDTVNLFMDYETFGEHQWAETGIFDFLKQLPGEILRNKEFDFKTPSEVIDAYAVKGEYDVHHFSSWADQERDLSAWLGNSLQQDAMTRIYALEKVVKATQHENILEAWSRLLTSDHFYYMCTKRWYDGEVHKYFSHYNTPYDGYINYMNVVTDLEYRLENIEKEIVIPAPNTIRLKQLKKKAGDKGPPEIIEPSIYM